MIGGLQQEPSGVCLPLPRCNRRTYRGATTPSRPGTAATSTEGLPQLPDRDIGKKGDLVIFTYVLGAMTEPMATEGISPQKKRGPPEEEKLSLEAIREVVRGEVGGSNAALKAELSHRMDRVESGVTNQLEKSLEKLAAITGQQQEQQRGIETIQGEHTGAKGAGPAVGGGVQHSRHGPGKPQASPHHGGVGGRHPSGGDPEPGPTDGQGPRHRASRRARGAPGVRYSALRGTPRGRPATDAGAPVDSPTQSAPGEHPDRGAWGRQG